MKKQILSLLIVSVIFLTACEDERRVTASEEADASVSAAPVSSQQSENEEPSHSSEQSSEIEEASSQPEEEKELELLVFGSNELEDQITRVLFTLHNPTEEELLIGQSYRLEKLHDDGGYRAVIYNTADSFGILDTSSYQFPILPGETGEISAYIGAIGELDEQSGIAKLPLGDYRIYIYVNDKEYSSDFSIVKSPENVGSLYSVSCEEPSYPTDVSEINVYIVNRSDSEIAFSPYPKLQYLDSANEWQGAELIESVAVPSIATVLAPGTTITETFYTDSYVMPLEPGTYRLQYSLEQNSYHYAFFMVE